MKIPIKHSNTKHLMVIAGAIALVGGVSAPIAAYAHGGSGNQQKSDHRWANHHRDDSSKDKTKHHSKGWFDWRNWENLSAQDFAKRNTQLQSRFDSYIDKNHLTVENRDTLKADVNTKAMAVETHLTALAEVRAAIGDDFSKATAEQRAELKTESTATFDAYYDYKIAVYDYKVAIKTAAETAGTKNSL